MSRNRLDRAVGVARLNDLCSAAFRPLDTLGAR